MGCECGGSATLARARAGGPSAPCSRASAPRPWPSCVSGMSGSIARLDRVEAWPSPLPPAVRLSRVRPVALDRHVHAAYGLRQRPRSAFGHGAASILAPFQAGGLRCFASGLVRAGRLDPRAIRAFGLRLAQTYSIVRMCAYVHRTACPRASESGRTATLATHTPQPLYCAQKRPKFLRLANNSPACCQ